MSLPKMIYLVGMPSSGKSTLGKSLARLLRYRFIDTDRLIVQKTKLSIPQIFEQKGERYFREVEREVLHALPLRVPMVVATGGGLPCFFDNMAYIRKTGISIFLDVPVAAIAERIRLHDKDDRPLLSKVDDLEAELQLKYTNRQTYYTQADLRVGDSISAPELVQLLYERFGPKSAD